MRDLYDDPFSEEATQAWETLKMQLKRGDTLFGQVVHQTRFGVFLDGGLGFPILLEVMEFEHAKKKCAFPEDFPAKGSRVEGRLAAFDENNRQIRVTQRFEKRAKEWPHWFA